MINSIKINLKNVINKGNFEEIHFKFIFSILNKLQQFKKYENKIINIETNEIKNLFLHKNNLSFKEKIQILSTISSIILKSPIFKDDTFIQFYKIDNEYEKENIYLKIKNFFFQILEMSNPESNIIQGLDLLFSKVLTDINQKNKTKNKKVFINDIKNFDNLKNQLKIFFPKIICRYFNSNDKSASFYDIIGEYVVINESIYVENEYNMIYGDYDDNKANFIYKIIEGKFNNTQSNNDLYNCFIFKGFWKIFHESFGNQPIQIINNHQVDTLKYFYDKGIMITQKYAGNILEYFISNDSSKIKLIKSINCNVNKLLDPKLFSGDFEEFWEIVDKIFENWDNVNESEVENLPENYYLVQAIYEAYYKDCKIKGDNNISVNISDFKRDKNKFRVRFKD